MINDKEFSKLLKSDYTLDSFAHGSITEDVLRVWNLKQRFLINPKNWYGLTAKQISEVKKLYLSNKKALLAMNRVYRNKQRMLVCL